MNLFRAIATVGGMTMLSRLFGFARDILVAHSLGAGLFADAFFVAFKFPNLFRRLFAEGAFSAAFVPIFAGLLETEGEDKAKRFAGEALSVLFWALVVFTIAMELAMPWAMKAFAPGFIDEPEKFDVTVHLTRVTFPYLMFISLVSLLAGILNSVGKFAAAAATPVILNLCLITAILGAAPFMESAGHALAWGVFAAGMVQFVWLLAHCLRAKMAPRLSRPRLTPQVKTLMRRLAPVAVGAGIYQVSLVIDTVIASLLPSGSISYLFYADRVNQLPLGVVGVAVGTALLPLLSRQVRAGNEAAALHSQNRALEFAFLLTLPAAAALMVIAEPVIVVLFQRGAFTSAEAQLTSKALAVYATGLPAYVLVKALATGYFAREDTKTPIKIGALAILVNLILNLLLMGPFKHVGIAMATSISSWLNAALLAFVLARRGHLAMDDRLRARLPRQMFAAIGMGAALWWAMGELAPWLSGPEYGRAGALALLVALGLAVFGALAQLGGAARVGEVKGMLRGRVGE